MKRIENFVLPEHTNTLYEKEAISSISLTKDVADKINELIDCYNAFSNTDLEWKQEQEGIIRKGVLYMKDNLLNTLNDLMCMFRDSGFIDDRIGYHCKIINERLNNLLGSVTEGSTTGDAELIDGRIDFTGKTWDTIGNHIRAFLELIGTPSIINREQIALTYNNLNLTGDFVAGDRIYVEPLSINLVNSGIKYITIMALYGDYAEDGYDILSYMLPDNVKPMIFTLNREYKGIRITFNLTGSFTTIAYGIIKKLGNDLASAVYENRVKTANCKTNYNLFEPVKLRYGAHQGYRAIAPANTLPAYEEACKNGFEWVWVAGCRQSVSGTWYVMHDATIDGTTNGSGAIKEMNDDQLNSYYVDVGVNVDKYKPEELKIPTVEEVVKICNKYGTNICLRLASVYTNATGVDHFKSLIEFVKKHNITNAIFSGNLKQMVMLKAFTDNWHGQVYVDTTDTTEVYNMIDTYVSYGWSNMSILTSYKATTKDVVEYCHKHGYKYVVCDIPTELDTDVVVDNLLSMGVDICQSGHIVK